VLWLSCRKDARRLELSDTVCLCMWVHMCVWLF
jgi:hypothetical protein